MRVTRSAVWEAAQVIAALSFVFLMGYMPHVLGYDQYLVERPSAREIASPIYHTLIVRDQEPYPYPIHVDEHIHWVYVANMQRNGEAQIADPYDPPAEGQNAFSSLRGAVHERGFHVVLASMQWITGVSFPTIFHYLPAAWFTFSAFGLYAALRPHPAAPLAAAFVGFVPTTVRFLGPGFLVPIGFVLAWLPVIMIVSRPALKRVSVAVLLIVLMFWSFFIHLIGGFAAVGLLLLVSAFGPTRERAPRLWMVALAILPLVWIARAFTGDVEAELLREEFLPIDFSIFDALGPFLILAWAAGLLLIVARPPQIAKPEILGASVLGLAVLMLILAGVVFGWASYSTYARWHPPFFFFAAVPLALLSYAIAELVWTPLLRLARKGSVGAAFTHAVGYGIAFSLIAVAGFNGLQEHAQTPYYRVMTDVEWDAIRAASQLAGPEHEVFLAHPWRAPFLAAITGKEPRSVLYPGNPPVNGDEYIAFVQQHSTLADFILNDITLVVSSEGRPPPGFAELAPNVYGLPPDVTAEIARIRSAEQAKS